MLRRSTRDRRPTWRAQDAQAQIDEQHLQEQPIISPSPVTVSTSPEDGLARVVEPRSTPTDIQQIEQQSEQTICWAITFNERRRLPHRLHWQRRCSFCNCRLLSTETNGWCCCQGQWVLPPLPPLPASWLPYFDGTFANLGQQSRQLNNIFAMSALGVSGNFLYPSGGSNVVVAGRTYHRLLDLQSGRHSLRWFVYDDAGHSREGAARGLPPAAINLIRYELERHNPYVRQLQQAAALHVASAFEITLAMPGVTSEVAALTQTVNLQAAQPRTVTVRSHGDNGHQYLSIFSPFYEPLQYPLLFPHGSVGWHPAAKPTFTQIRWYRRRLLMEDRFQLLSRLAQEYMVDMYSRVEDERLAYIRRGREMQMQMQRQRQQQRGAAIEETEDDPAWRTSLPSSFLGSRAWCSNQVADALALCRQFGRPSLFITMTTNPHWPEITERLLPRQQATDVPQLVVRVFKAKLQRLLTLLKNGSGGFFYSVYVIEFQKRGFPHCHLLVKLRHELGITQIDHLVKAELPLEEDDPALREIISRCNMHPTTHLESERSRCNRRGQCVYNFPQSLQEQTTVDEFGRVHLRRRHVDDVWVVSYIPVLSRELNCHLHVDVCSNVSVIMYLYKYLFKGVDYAQARVQSQTTVTTNTSTPTAQDAVASVDELEDYVNCRYLSSSEAMWRIFSYHITQKYPSIVTLAFHLPGRQLGQMGRSAAGTSRSEASMLLYYLHRPLDRCFDELRFGEYYSRYRRKKRLTAIELQRTHWQEQPIPGAVLTPYWVVSRQRQISVTRLKIVSPMTGELYYLRHLLRCQSGRSFEDLRTVDGVRRSTFQDAAAALGLFQHEAEAEQTLEEAVVNFYAPHQLRFLFAQLLIDLPAPARHLWDRFADAMSADFPQLVIMAQRHNRALQELASLLLSRGCTLAQFQLPAVQASLTELDREEELLALEREQNERYWRDHVEQMNAEQRRLFDMLCRAQDSQMPQSIFVDGRAGRGKSFLLLTFVARCRARQIPVLIVGSTALSVMSYSRGQTAHSAFGIPVSSNDIELTSKIQSGTRRWQFLQAMRVVIWEELPMMHRAGFECASLLMQAVSGTSDGLMGRTLLLATGDFRQVAPVIKRGSRSEVYEASVRAAPYWPQFQVYSLLTPIRTETDQELTTWLDAVGDGQLAHKRGWISLSQFESLHSISETLEFLFPAEILAAPTQCIQRALLSPLNVTVDHHNQQILERLPGVQISLFGSSWLKEEDPDLRRLQSTAVDEYLSTIHESGVPASELQLKVGAVCALMRNLSLERGLVKNARVIVVKIYRHSVIVQLLQVDGLSAQTYAVPRINFEFVPQWANYTVCRRQFPLRLAYATTFNSCQGLTLTKAVIDISIQSFAHGQLYTSLSRVRRTADLRVYVENAEQEVDLCAQNVVWPELLL